MNGKTTRTAIPILMYHSISRCSNHRFRRFTVSPERFAEQMDYLARQGYVPITVSAMAEGIRGRASLPERAAVITFDDGFADFYTQALPVLRRHGFSATLFLVTSYVAGTSRWLAAEGEGGRPLLDWDQIAEISASGIECGGHTHTHPQLDALPSGRAREEIERCRDILEERLCVSVRSFAYPFGYYNSSVKRAVRRAGYKSACAVNYRTSSVADDPFALSRLIIMPDMTMPEFASLLSGRGLPPAMLFQQVRSKVWRLVRPYATETRRRLEQRTVAR